jgi:hypothetical protein
MVFVSLNLHGKYHLDPKVQHLYRTKGQFSPYYFLEKVIKIVTWTYNIQLTSNKTPSDILKKFGTCFIFLWFKNLVMTFRLTYFSLKFHKIGVNQTFFNKIFWVRDLDDIYHASLGIQIPYIMSLGPRWHNRTSLGILISKILTLGSKWYLCASWGTSNEFYSWIKYEQSHISLWPRDFCGQELSWADTGSEACDRPPDGSPSCQYKSWPAKNFVNRGTKKTPAPPSPVTK